MSFRNGSSEKTRVRTTTFPGVSKSVYGRNTSNDTTEYQVTFTSPFGRRFSKELNFDACLDGNASQGDLTHAFGIHQLLDGVLAGYNVCILAYGPTGSGKTHTMTGTPEATASERQGIIQMAASYLLKSTENDAQSELTASFVEIYNEAVYDLLSSSERRLEVKWTEQSGFRAVGAATAHFSNMEDVNKTIEQGMKWRKVDMRKLSSRSSRSHTIFTIESAHRGARGELMLVDLAGSERLKDSYQNKAETAKINSSLFCLGKVIHALSERAQESHVPYRDSVLTKLLMQGIGGDALTLLITCCSPCDVHVEETINALAYAQKARGIVNATRFDVNRLPNDELYELRTEVKILRKQNRDLRYRLQYDVPQTVPSDEFRPSSCADDIAENINNGMNPEISICQRDKCSADVRDSVLEDIAALKDKLKRLEFRFDGRKHGLTDQCIAQSYTGIALPMDPSRRVCDWQCSDNRPIGCDTDGNGLGDMAISKSIQFKEMGNYQQGSVWENEAITTPRRTKLREGKFSRPWGNSEEGIIVVDDAHAHLKL